MSRQDMQCEADTNLVRDLESVIIQYKRRLENSLKPKEDPGDYDAIINEGEYRTQFDSFLDTNLIFTDLKLEFLQEFDRQVADIRKQFRDDYNQGLINTFLFNLIPREEDADNCWQQNAAEISHSSQGRP